MAVTVGLLGDLEPHETAPGIEDRTKHWAWSAGADALAVEARRGQDAGRCAREQDFGGGRQVDGGERSLAPFDAK